MRITKSLLLVALAVMPLAMTSNAQVLQANIAGSSAQFLEAGQGIGPIGTPGNCAWTNGSSTNNLLTDQRVAAPGNTDGGKLWVVWTPGSTGTCAAPSADSQVYTYLSTDSTVGNRCLFAQPSCTLGTLSAAGAAGANALTGVTDTPLPAGVLSAFNNQPVTIAATDVLPADAKFATVSALASCAPLGTGSQFSGYGYGPGPIGTDIKSSFDGTSFHVIDFNIFGNDPITNTAVPSTVFITPVGASPELVVVNTQNANPTGFGDPAVKNINRTTLMLFQSGLAVRTADVLNQAWAGSSATYYGVTALLREPLSGTYRTMEHSIPNNKEFYKGQESYNCGTGTTYIPVLSNPLNLTRTVGTTTGTRKRVIGTGQMVTELTSVQDSIGYAFWSAANFAGKSNIKYLTVDGVDPILDTYSNGTIPQSGNGLLPSVTLSHVKDGSYGIWSMLRLVSTSSAAQTVAQTIASAEQGMVSFGSGATQPDFVPASQLNVFRGHYAPAGVNFNSGNVASTGACGKAEAGGDVGGVVFTNQAGLDYCVLKGSTTNGPGPVNDSSSGSASFGVRQ
jgi:hypothetical protein